MGFDDDLGYRGCIASRWDTCSQSEDDVGRSFSAGITEYPIIVL